MQLAPLSTSLNTQISVNIYTHAETNVAAISAVILAQDSQQRMQPTFWLPHATPFLPATAAAAATIRSISSNQVILIHYAYAGNTWETCTSATTMAAQCRSGSRLLTLAGHWHWGQVHVHFALRCRAQACGEHSLPVCECVYLHVLILYTPSHTHTHTDIRSLAHT